jgi:hypothetical protein
MSEPAMSSAAGVADVDPTTELIRQFGGGDPRMQLIAELFRQRQAASSPPAEDTSSALERMTARCERLREIVRTLRTRNDLVASALGACPRCWGEDEECPMCEGHGVPGAFEPRTEAFEELVLPALRRVRSRRLAESGRKAVAEPGRPSPAAVAST